MKQIRIEYTLRSTADRALRKRLAVVRDANLDGRSRDLHAFLWRAVEAYLESR